MNESENQQLDADTTIELDAIDVQLVDDVLDASAKAANPPASARATPPELPSRAREPSKAPPPGAEVRDAAEALASHEGPISHEGLIVRAPEKEALDPNTTVEFNRLANHSRRLTYALRLDEAEFASSKTEPQDRSALAEPFSEPAEAQAPCGTSVAARPESYGEAPMVRLRAALQRVARKRVGRAAIFIALLATTVATIVSTAVATAVAAGVSAGSRVRSGGPESALALCSPGAATKAPGQPSRSPSTQTLTLGTVEIKSP